MRPARVDINLRSNADYVSTWTGYADTAMTQPFDFTGCSAVMRIRRSPTDATAIIDMGTTANTTITLGGTAGTIYRNIKQAVYATVGLVPTEPQSPYEYDLVITDAAGNVQVWFEGKVHYKLGVS